MKQWIPSVDPCLRVLHWRKSCQIWQRESQCRRPHSLHSGQRRLPSQVSSLLRCTERKTIPCLPSLKQPRPRSLLGSLEPSLQAHATAHAHVRTYHVALNDSVKILEYRVTFTSPVSIAAIVCSSSSAPARPNVLLSFYTFPGTRSFLEQALNKSRLGHTVFVFEGVFPIGRYEPRIAPTAESGVCPRPGK